MFTPTNVAATTVSAGVGGPVATVVSPTFQIITSPVNPTSPSTTISPVWRLTSTSSSSSLIKQPTLVSIVNKNINVTSSTSVPIVTAGIRLPTHSIICSKSSTTSQSQNPVITGNLILRSPQTLGLVSARLQPTLTCTINNNTTTLNSPKQIIIQSNSSSNNLKPGFCIDTPILGRLAPIQRQIITTPLTQSLITENQKSNLIDEQTDPIDSCLVSKDDNSLVNEAQDQEIEIFIKNVVCSFSLCCKMDLRKIAKQAANVVYERERAVVMMKLRNPNCSANIWSSGKVTVTGTTSEDDALRGARRIARSMQRLGFKVKFRHYRVVNCLATCAMPWHIDIIKLTRTYSECTSYEPEINPGATVRLSGNAVLKVFTTGNLTVIAPSIERINTAVYEFYPQLFECRKLKHDQGQC